MKPWLTTQAVIFLDQLLKSLPQSHMLEFGSGNSTLWFAQRAYRLISIDHDIRWHTVVKEQCQQFSNVDLRLIPGTYYTICATFPDNYFDIILVDGKDRVRCIQESLRILKPGGIIMLDDAERTRYAPVFELLKNFPHTITEEKKPNKSGELVTSQTIWWIKT